MTDRITHEAIRMIREGDWVRSQGSWYRVWLVEHTTCCRGNPIAKITAEDDSGLVNYTDTVFEGWPAARVAYRADHLEAAQ